MKKKTIDTKTVEETETTKEYKEIGIKSPLIVTSFILALIGILFLFLTEDSVKMVSYIIGSALILIGLIVGVVFFFNKEESKKTVLLAGILYLILGILVIIFPLALIELATIIFGIYLIVNGVLKLYSGFMKSKVFAKMWQVTMVIGLLATILGVLLIIKPFTTFIILKVAGASLLVMSVYDILNHFIFERKNN